jgi:hypothetical protein
VREAAEKALLILGRPGENDSALYDRQAEIFHKETWEYAPGKDVPSAVGYTKEYGERRNLWVDWMMKKRAEARTALAAFDGKEGERKD